MYQKTYRTITNFWFNTLSPQQWWEKDATLDQHINNDFGSYLQQARLGELAHWRENSEGRLAEIIVLDQFSRNIYRDQPEAFAQDITALVLAQEAIYQNIEHDLEKELLQFIYMPFMHSESKKIHEQAVELFEFLGDKDALDFELKHQAIIEKFGRYPHRNKILKRQSTPAEEAFLATEGSSF